MMGPQGRKIWMWRGVLKKNDHVLSFAHECFVVLTLIFLSDHFLLIWNDIPCFALLSEFDKARGPKEKHWAVTVWARGWQQSRLQTWRQTWGRVFSWDVDLMQGKSLRGGGRLGGPGSRTIPKTPVKIYERSSGNISGGKVKKEKVGLMKVRGMMRAAGKHSTMCKCDNEMTASRDQTLNFFQF